MRGQVARDRGVLRQVRHVVAVTRRVDADRADLPASVGVHCHHRHARVGERLHRHGPVQGQVDHQGHAVAHHEHGSAAAVPLLDRRERVRHAVQVHLRGLAAGQARERALEHLAEHVHRVHAGEQRGLGEQLEVAERELLEPGVVAHLHVRVVREDLVRGRARAAQRAGVRGRERHGCQVAPGRPHAVQAVGRQVGVAPALQQPVGVGMRATVPHQVEQECGVAHDGEAIPWRASVRARPRAPPGRRRSRSPR